MGFPADRIEDIKTAVSEATLNAIEHGNALDAAQSVLIVFVPEPERLEISVRDRSPRELVPPAPSRAGPGACRTGSLASPARAAGACS